MNKPSSISRGRILDAAEVLFSQKGFDGARVDEIAKRAGVNKALIYYYFSSKDEILQTLINDFITQMAGFFLELSRGEYAFNSPETEEVMGRYSAYLAARKNLLRIMMVESLKSSTAEPPIFSLIDFSRFVNVQEDAVMENLEKRGFNLDKDRNQRMITEFFTGVLPEVCYIIFKDQWVSKFQVSGEQMDAMYAKAIEMTHKAHYQLEK